MLLLIIIFAIGILNGFINVTTGGAGLVNTPLLLALGLDPYMAQTELEAGSQLLYRNINFNSWGFLNAREDFITRYPAYVTKVLAAYERAREWILENPDETAKILSEEAKITIEVAKRELVERTVLTSSPVPGPEQTAVLEAIIPIFEAEDQLSPGADARKALAELYEPTFIAALVTTT